MIWRSCETNLEVIMWNPTTHAHYSGAQLGYGSDLTDVEWHRTEP